MTLLNILWYLVSATIVTGCVTAPAIVPGKGAIYGIVSADSHKAIVEKAASGIDAEYSAEDGKIVYTKEMINYRNLEELYVCLIDPNYSGGKEHLLVMDESGMSLRSLALAKGDKLRVRNSTPRTQDVFVSAIDDTEQGFQAFPPLRPGTESVFTITVEGDLEFRSEEDEHLVTSLLSRNGLIGRRQSSGSFYAFERLAPGTYDVLFWFWRLGYVQHRIDVRTGQNVRLDQTLSVDRVIH